MKRTSKMRFQSTALQLSPVKRFQLRRNVRHTPSRDNARCYQARLHASTCCIKLFTFLCRIPCISILQASQPRIPIAHLQIHELLFGGWILNRMHSPVDKQYRSSQKQRRIRFLSPRHNLLQPVRQLLGIQPSLLLELIVIVQRRMIIMRMRVCE